MRTGYMWAIMNTRWKICGIGDTDVSDHESAGDADTLNDLDEIKMKIFINLDGQSIEWN